MTVRCCNLYLEKENNDNHNIVYRNGQCLAQNRNYGLYFLLAYTYTMYVHSCKHKFILLQAFLYVSFIGGGNRRKPPTRRKSLKNLIT
jgi:hypothetical protein